MRLAVVVLMMLNFPGDAAVSDIRRMGRPDSAPEGGVAWKVAHKLRRGRNLYKKASPPHRRRWFVGVSSCQGATEMAIVWETLKLPLNRPIPLGLAPESWVLLEGSIPPESKWFCLDFAYGQFRGASIPLRFQLSFEGPLPSSPAIITLNAFMEGQWGKEIRVPAHIRPGEKFKMQLIVTRKGYKIMENDTFLCDFEHRLPVNRISFLEMSGDIILESFKSSWENSNTRSRLL